MKILVIQLARPGDIFSTWPTLSALKRNYPQAELHLLVRKKFASAAADFSIADHVWTFDSAQILRALIEDCCKVNESTHELRTFIEQLQAEKFEKIVNLTFSAASSLITHLAAGPQCEVRGYTRTSDFYLSIPDEASQYFKAHVGVGGSNRIHLYDLFAMVAAVELSSADLFLYRFNLPKTNIVCHLGASQAQKTWPTSYWTALISKLCENHHVALVGGKDDVDRGNQVEKLITKSGKTIENFIGKTNFTETARVISSARLFIGVDSGPLHIANCAGTLSLNLSLGAVNFWETGPTVIGSQILVSHKPSALLPEEVYLTAESMLQQNALNPNSKVCDGHKFIRYEDFGKNFDPGWDTLQWIYFKGEQVKLVGDQLKMAEQILEICELSIVQIEAYAKDPAKTECLEVLIQTDNLLKVIRHADRALAPLIQRFFGCKENVPPGSREQIIFQTLRCYEDLKINVQKILVASVKTVTEETSFTQGERHV